MDMLRQRGSWNTRKRSRRKFPHGSDQETRDDWQGGMSHAKAPLEAPGPTVMKKASLWSNKCCRGKEITFLFCYYVYVDRTLCVSVSVSVSASVSVCLYVTTCMWRSDNNAQELVLSFHCGFWVPRSCHGCTCHNFICRAFLPA